MSAIGIISPYWLPRWGGAEQYHYRAAKALMALGVPLRILCATAAEPQRDNGSIAVERYVPRGNFENASWTVGRNENPSTLRRELSKQYDFMNRAVAWCRENGIRVALLGSPLQVVYMQHARELFMRLKDQGITVGLFHHDIPHATERTLHDTYMNQPASWEEAARRMLSQMAKLAEVAGTMHCALTSGSPLLFEPDFVVSNSNWSARFIDPTNSTRHFVLHPLLDAAKWSRPPAPEAALAPADVLMVNPQRRKGPDIMKAVIAGAPAGRSFRVLKGGWGEAFQSFVPEIEGLPAYRDGRVDLVDYVKDIRTAYQAAGVLLFPSIVEGYGMTPVEAMLCGTPVVSSNYPAILEAVGEGALTLCPHKDDPAAWVAAVETVLANRAAWQAKARERAAFLLRRQAHEITAFRDFLLALGP